MGIECLKKHKNTTGSCPCTPAPDLRTKGNSWSASFLLHIQSAKHTLSSVSKKSLKLLFNIIIFSGQVQKRRPLFFPRVMKQSTIRVHLTGKVTPVNQYCPTAPLRRILEFGHLRRRTKRETTFTLVHH